MYEKGRCCRIIPFQASPLDRIDEIRSLECYQKTLLPQIYISPKHGWARTDPVLLEEKSLRTKIQVLEKPEAFFEYYKMY